MWSWLVLMSLAGNVQAGEHKIKYVEYTCVGNLETEIAGVPMEPKDFSVKLEGDLARLDFNIANGLLTINPLKYAQFDYTVGKENLAVYLSSTYQLSLYLGTDQFLPRDFTVVQTDDYVRLELCYGDHSSRTPYMFSPSAKGMAKGTINMTYFTLRARRLSDNKAISCNVSLARGKKIK